MRKIMLFSIVMVFLCILGFDHVVVVGNENVRDDKINAKNSSVPKKRLFKIDAGKVTEIEDELMLNVAGLTVWTWTDAGCVANWGNVCEGEMNFYIPEKDWEYCDHSFVPLIAKQGYYRLTDVNMAGIRYWVKAVGGPPWDQFESKSLVTVSVGAVRKTATDAERRAAGCKSINTGRPHMAACVSLGSAQKPDIASCLKNGAYGTCWRLTDLINSRCVKDQSEAVWFQQNYCDNTLYPRYEYLYIENSSQCK